MGDLLWFLALALGVAGAMLIGLAAAARGATPDPCEHEEYS